MHMHMYNVMGVGQFSNCTSFSLPCSGWLSSSDDPLGYVDRIDDRIEDFTGLTMETAEQLQVRATLQYSDCC